MFTQTFVDGTTHSKTPYTLGISFLLQSFALCALILIPLVYTQVLPNAQLRDFLLMPAAPAPPPVAPIGIKPFHSAVSRPLFQLAFPHVSTPQRISSPSNATAAPDIGLTGDIVGPSSLYGVPGGLIGSVSGGVPPPPESAATKPIKPSGPIRIGNGVSESLLIHRVQPVYPPLANQRGCKV